MTNFLITAPYKKYDRSTDNFRTLLEYGISSSIKLNFRVLAGVGCTRVAAINNFFILLTFTIKTASGAAH